MKKLSVKIIGCIVVFSAVLALATCQSLSSAVEEPVLSLQSVDLEKISLTGAELLCKINVENPNSIDIPLPEIGWEFFVSNYSFVNGIIKSNGSIKSRKTTEVNVPVNVKYTEMIGVVESLAASKETDYKVALDLKIPLPVLEHKTWHFEHEGNLPILRAPVVKFQSFDVKNMTLSKLDFELKLEIENKDNNRAMTVKDLAYNLAVDGSNWSEGNVQNPPRLAAGQKAVVPISFSLNSLSMVSKITQIITGNEDVSYALTGDLAIGFDDLPALADLGTSIDVNGTTKLKK